MHADFAGNVAIHIDRQVAAHPSHQLARIGQVAVDRQGSHGTDVRRDLGSGPCLLERLQVLDAAAKAGAAA